MDRAASPKARISSWSGKGTQPFACSISPTEHRRYSLGRAKWHHPSYNGSPLFPQGKGPGSVATAPPNVFTQLPVMMRALGRRTFPRNRELRFSLQGRLYRLYGDPRTGRTTTGGRRYPKRISREAGALCCLFGNRSHVRLWLFKQALSDRTVPASGPLGGWAGSSPDVFAWSTCRRLRLRRKRTWDCMRSHSLVACETSGTRFACAGDIATPSVWSVGRHSAA